MEHDSTAGTSLWALLLTALFVASCGDDDSSRPPFESNVRPANATCVAPEPATDNAAVSLEPVFEDAFGGNANQILHAEYVTSIDSGRWYFARRLGQIYTIKQGDEELTKVLDLADRLWLEHSEVGILGMAVDPEFDENPYIYVSHTVPSSDENGMFDSRVARYRALDDSGTEFDADSEVVLLDIPQSDGSHNGNHLAFGPDGYLYFSTGDGGRRRTDGRSPRNLYSSILRLDVRNEGPESGPPYSIPADNPFADGVDGSPEVFAYGLRNPWRFSVDPVTAEVWAGDVGENLYEEINLVLPGRNYGWNQKEGFTCFEAPGDCPAEELGLTDPVWVYPHSEGESVTGGIVYRGSELTALSGRYMYADYLNGNIWALRTEADGTLASDLLIESGMLIPEIAYGPGHEAYVVRYRPSEGGPTLYKMTASAESEDQFPKFLSETGCVDPDDPRQPASGVVTYPIIAPLWSDGAGKDRRFAIPDDRAITLDEDGDFIFPVGTVLMKDFGFGERIHETRLYIRHEDEWAGYSYAWNDEQTDAELLSGSKTLILGNGQSWKFPSRGDCARCHTEAAGRSLGPELRQFDGQVVPAATSELMGESDFEGDFLDWLIEYEYFYDDFTNRDEVESRLGTGLVRPEGDAGLDDRARSYLHANCSGCHRPGGTGRVDMDLTIMASIEQMNVCDKPIEASSYDAGRDDFRVVDPGDPENSALYRRMSERGQPYQMPPLATHIVDDDASELVREWIMSMGEDCKVD